MSNAKAEARQTLPRPQEAVALRVRTDLRAGADSRRMEAFGDAIGNYNFRVEIDGVDAGQ